MKILPLLLLGAVGVGAFAPASRSAFSPHALRMSSAVEEDTAASSSSSSFAEDDNETELTGKGLLRRDRYVATNRFAVRPGKEAKFEKRWATRKSRLASLDGFKYFHLMRRVALNEDGTTSYLGGDKADGTNMGNYVSFTIWQKKSHFSAWRKGDAFKEAHGGTSIGASSGAVWYWPALSGNNPSSPNNQLQPDSGSNIAKKSANRFTRNTSPSLALTAHGNHRKEGSTASECPLL